MSGIFETKPHFLIISSRWSCQRLSALLRTHKLLCSFQITVSLLGSSVSCCHSGGGLAYTASPSSMCALWKAVFHVCWEHRATFASEVCRMREQHSLMLSMLCLRRRPRPSRLPQKPLSTYRALFGFSTHLPLMTFSLLSLSYASV